MISIEQHETDDKLFIELCSRIINDLGNLHKPINYYVVHIKNWFDSKWLEFSGKSIGALGVWNSRLTIPPFVPNRVLSERLFKRVEENGLYQEHKLTKKLHPWQCTSENENRFIDREFPESGFYWYSSKTKQNSKGSMMAYMPFGNEMATFYVGFDLINNVWKPTKLVGITEHELQILLQSGKQGIAT
jgi:hypothetical protein